MNKDELIGLSDLNREDNIKYISSEAQGIAITLNSDKYAPTICKLERAYICGRRKSEEQIEKVKYTLKKIIETVHNERIDEYGARLVLIKDFAYECLEELEKWKMS